MAEHTTGPEADARTDYNSWKGLDGNAARRARLAGKADDRAYWAAYAAEADRLTGNGPGGLGPFLDHLAGEPAPVHPAGTDAGVPF